MLDKNINRDWHTFIEERVSDYLDNQLPSLEHARFERHLRGCPRCQRTLASYQWTLALLKNAPSPALPRQFTLPVPRAAPRAPIFGLSALRLAAAIATLILVSLLGVDVINQLGGAASSSALPAARSAQQATKPSAGVPPTIVALVPPAVGNVASPSAPTLTPFSASGGALVAPTAAPVATAVPPPAQPILPVLPPAPVATKAAPLVAPNAVPPTGAPQPAAGANPPTAPLPTTASGAGVPPTATALPPEVAKSAATSAPVPTSAAGASLATAATSTPQQPAAPPAVAAESPTTPPLLLSQPSTSGETPSPTRPTGLGLGGGGPVTPSPRSSADTLATGSVTAVTKAQTQGLPATETPSPTASHTPSPSRTPLPSPTPPPTATPVPPTILPVAPTLPPQVAATSAGPEQTAPQALQPTVGVAPLLQPTPPPTAGPAATPTKVLVPPTATLRPQALAQPTLPPTALPVTRQVPGPGLTPLRIGELAALFAAVFLGTLSLLLWLRRR